MIGRIVGGIVGLGILWGILTWAGDGHPMPSEDWWNSIRGKGEELVDVGEDIGDKLPKEGGILPDDTGEKIRDNFLTPPNGDR